MPFGWAAAAAAVGGIASAAISSSGAQSAAQTQANAAQNAQNISQQEFNTITNQEMPFLNSGIGAEGQLNYLLGNGTPGQGTGQNQGAITANSSPAGGYGSLLTPFTADYMKQYSPAYQFQMQQGQQGVLNQDATSQGAESGAALKDLIGYDQNYANTAYSNAFNQYQTQQGNVYSRLMGVAQLGQNAASNTGQQGTALAGQAAQSASNIGSALGGGQLGSANAFAGGVNNGFNSLGSFLGAYGQGGSQNPNNPGGSVGGSMVTYYDANGNPYQGTVASGGF